MQKNFFCVFSDSGTFSEESAILGFAGILLRTSTERPEVLDKGTVVIVGISGEVVEQAIDQTKAIQENNKPPLFAPDYTDENVSVKVTKIIQSHGKIIDKFVWRKSYD